MEWRNNFTVHDTSYKAHAVGVYVGTYFIDCLLSVTQQSENIIFLRILFCFGDPL